MNWDRGLKRITLVLSIIGAVIAAGFSLDDAMTDWDYKNDKLVRESWEVYSEDDGRYLINFWNDRDRLANLGGATISEQRQTWWKALTGLEFGEEPLRLKAITELQRRGISIEPKTQTGLRMRAEELERLKELGWQTAKGEPLPLTTEEFWKLRQQSRIKNLENTVRQKLNDIPGLTALGAILGFCGVWVIYAVVRWGALPLYKWISVGFFEDKQEDLKKTNE